MKDDQRVTLTKKLLKDALLRLLENEPISKISVTRLCAEAGVNRATFYRHYSQPRDVIVDIRYDLFHKVSALMSQRRAGGDPRQWVEDMCRYFYDHAQLLKILFTCRTDEEFVDFINQLYRTYSQQIRQAGYWTELDDQELKLSTYCLAGGVYYVLRQWINEPIDKTPQQVAQILYRHLGIR